VGDLPNRPAGAGVTSDERAEEEDRTLAIRAAGGDAEAFGILYDRHVDAVYRYVFYRVRNDAEAEDVTSDVFMKALRAIPRYQPRQAFLAWLYRIARNAVIDRGRRLANRTQVTFEDALSHGASDRVIDPNEALLAGSDALAVRAAIGHLSRLQQEVIIFRYVQGLDTAQICKITGRRDGTIRGIEFRALGALRGLIPSRESL